MTPFRVLSTFVGRWPDLYVQEALFCFTVRTFRVDWSLFADTTEAPISEDNMLFGLALKLVKRSGIGVNTHHSLLPRDSILQTTSELLFSNILLSKSI